ncbi:response regulator transcription factor [Streptomyces sp. NPDC021224]|uniref:helix-turn-helix transcriptional regulator n=1 Tax=unclassified Streptomyces TaxID=2593676 RepID=UPI003799E540
MSVDRIAVDLRAWDPISQAGVASQLRLRPEVRLLDRDPEAASVVVAVVDAVDDEVLGMLRQIHRAGSPRGVLVVTLIDENQLVKAAECGFIGVIRRSEASPAKLVEVIGAVARGEGYVPADLLGGLLVQVGRFQGDRTNVHGLNLSRLNEREIEVLRLVAEGCSTADIALKLAYSDRTIKNILHSVMTRLNLRTRSQAVAYAMRQGLI